MWLEYRRSRVHRLRKPFQYSPVNSLIFNMRFKSEGVELLDPVVYHRKITELCRNLERSRKSGDS